MEQKLGARFLSSLQTEIVLDHVADFRRLLARRRVDDGDAIDDLGDFGRGQRTGVCGLEKTEGDKGEDARGEDAAQHRRFVLTINTIFARIGSIKLERNIAPYSPAEIENVVLEFSLVRIVARRGNRSAKTQPPVGHKSHRERQRLVVVQPVALIIELGRVTINQVSIDRARDLKMVVRLNCRLISLLRTRLRKAQGAVDS